ncbi:hypothetical protein RV03_GL003534 [Enterococcus gallinarum]|nr:hypothetical protein RV03_GL003534 [Enterococcus gallinarum]
MLQQVNACFQSMQQAFMETRCSAAAFFVTTVCKFIQFVTIHK